MEFPSFISIILNSEKNCHFQINFIYPPDRCSYKDNQLTYTDICSVKLCMFKSKISHET